MLVQSIKFPKEQSNFWQKNSSYKNNKSRSFSKSISFKGNPSKYVHNVTLLDSGQHASNMMNLMKSLLKDPFQINLKHVPVILVNEAKYDTRFEALKTMRELKEELSKINKTDNKPEYLIIPALCNVPLLNLSDQIASVMKKRVNLTASNIKNNKCLVLSFLETIAEHPSTYSKEIGYMDKNKQGMEHTFGVIQEINKAVESGIKVFIPAGHPQHNNIDHLIQINNLKPEYYHYLATGNDVGEKISSLKRQCDEDNWYDFNLLTLSNAENLGITKPDGTKFFHSAYDSCVTDFARGTFNLSPVRRNGKIQGYSFLDQETVHLKKVKRPDDTFIEKFVGLPVRDVLATPIETQKFKMILSKTGEKSKSDLAFLDEISCKLFKVEDIFSGKEIKGKKINLKGKYTDYSLKMYFDENKNGQIIFPQCDCEASGRPSVASIWGSCFSLVSKITQKLNDVHSRVYTKFEDIPTFKDMTYEYFISMAERQQTEKNLNQAISRKQLILGKDHPSLIQDYFKMGEHLEKTVKYSANVTLEELEALSKDYALGYQEYNREDLTGFSHAEKVYNEALRIAQLNFHPKSPIIADCYMKIGEMCEKKSPSNLEAAENCLNEAIDIYSYSDKKNENIPIAFNRIGDILRKQNKDYFANLSKNAAYEIKNNTSKGQELIKKRAYGIKNISGIMTPEEDWATTKIDMDEETSLFDLLGQGTVEETNNRIKKITDRKYIYELVSLLDSDEVHTHDEVSKSWELDETFYEYTAKVALDKIVEIGKAKDASLLEPFKTTTKTLNDRDTVYWACWNKSPEYSSHDFKDDILTAIEKLRGKNQ